MSQEDYKVIVIGGGPAGLAAAMTLANAGMKDVLVLERGVKSGSKNVMGGILFTPSLEKIIPSIWDTDAPLERPVVKRSFAVLSGDSSALFSFQCGEFSRPPYNHSFTVLRRPFDGWMAERAEQGGVTVLNGVVAESLLRDERNRVVGVGTRVEEGLDPREGELRSALVILAEGANALLAEKEGLRPKILPQDMAVAVKEVISMPPEAIEARFNLNPGQGEGREYYGDAVKGMFGSGFIYTNRDSLSVGIAVSVRDLSASGETPNDLLELFKGHPSVKPLLEGGETREYAAHMIPEGGYYRLAKLYDDGLLVVGDAAGLVNVSPYHEGANLAVASGILAGETALEAITKEDTSAETLAAYALKLESSFVIQDMKKFADLPGFLKEHPRLFSAWPAGFLGMLRDIFTVSEDPKQVLENKAMDRLQKEIGLVPLLTTLWGMRGATRSFYHEATEKALDYLKRNY